jgi:hypothetical protein
VTAARSWLLRAKFSCVVEDQWAVAMLLRMLEWRA